jgi:uncharacterized protein
MQCVDISQAEIIEFLSRPETHGGQETVQRIDTHVSVIFLAGARAYKLKRAVRFEYLDYSTLDRRRRFCELEVAINRRTAPEIYRGVAAVTRAENGALALDGAGQPVEYLVVMRRFDQDNLLDRVAERGALDDALALRIADRIAGFHQDAEIDAAADAATAFAEAVARDCRQITRRPDDVFDPDDARRFSEQLTDGAGRVAPLLAARGRAGRVRRCHGDLHLRNICLFDGEPTLFDAIEFDDRLAVIDVFYDLAFLLMDMEFRAQRNPANALFNRYLQRGGDYGGLGALRYFMASRAGIRAHVAASAADAQPDRNAATDLYRDARRYLALGLALLDPPPPRLIAIGGLSGAGKSVLARALAPAIGAAPGAVVLHSDVVRKTMLGQDPEAALPPDAYREAISQTVYDEILARAAGALDSGYSVLCDATYLDPARRGAVERIAEAAGAGFTGLWLDAPRTAMAARIRARRNDASDADEAVLRSQLDADPGAMAWRRIPAGGDAAETLREARRALAGRSAEPAN